MTQGQGPGAHTDKAFARPEGPPHPGHKPRVRCNSEAPLQGTAKPFVVPKTTLHFCLAFFMAFF